MAVWTPPVNLVTNEVPGSTRLNQQLFQNVLWLHDRDPRYVVAPSAVSGITTTETVVATLTIPAQSGTYDARLAADLYLVGTVSGDAFAVRVRRGTTTAGTLVWQKDFFFTPGLVFSPSIVEVVDTIAGGTSQSYVLSLVRLTGTGSISSFASSIQSMFRAYAHVQ